ncbi:Phage antirepressor protein KilAC domain protein [Leuconostoc suionicum]|uniref:Phage antirepressor protein KilAC domain protein n=1 Tax=Leuconostoc suionicum TaxID=1511761 RepID=A0A2N9K785_9LACO|nr:phage antirepressor KilAC domain-containing protein [Leuconostoc suionicum]SPD94474.1 Phage antirepressor protein KilAC domain protein [Leuconostoc suionicum]SPE06136.1 Phage antirepressor protein KilAC domain protein [Leuconostoc suionicum]SPH04907.1 Phage antirepressor protein KilAC domain protein [Leuconostoc suionicum]
MEEIIKINQNEQGEAQVSARDLHKALNVKARFNDWITRMIEYGFTEDVDFYSFLSKTSNGGRPSVEYNLTISTAKEIAMLQRNEKGKQVRNYFIQVEERYKQLASDPSYQMALGLKASQQLLEHKDKIIAEMKPKALFADAVSASQTSILVGELAKLLKQNGIDTGANRLFTWLRDNGYLIRRKGTDYNMPTQKSMEMGLFEIKEHNHINSNGVNVTTKTPKVTGKGQQYFINKFLQAA